MSSRLKRLLWLATVLVGLSLYWGCSQPDMILATKSHTVMYLEPERLPTTPPQVLYCLAVAETLARDSVRGVEKIARFRYDFDSRAFLNPDGTARPDSNRFEFAKDIWAYSRLLILLENPDDTTEVGPVMLIDTITPDSVNPVQLVFPYSDSLWHQYALYNMKTVSDDSGLGDFSTEANGAAIWFNTVQASNGSLQDTVALLSIDIDSFWHDTFPGDADTVSVVDTASTKVDTILRGFGLDTLTQQVVRIQYVTHTAYIDSPPPWLTTAVTLHYRVGANIYNDTTHQVSWRENAVDSFRYQDYVQLGPDFKDLRKSGWVYCGWVVSDLIGNASIGHMTPPAWVGYNGNMYDSLIHGINGGLLSTGLFARISEPDFSNPYVGSRHHVPPFPGEDFLENLPHGVQGPLNLVPGDRCHGTVFITLEPREAAYRSDTTNFPLILNAIALPARRDSTGLAPILSQNMGMPNTGCALRIFSETGSDVGGPFLIGFPKVKVKYTRI